MSCMQTRDSNPLLDPTPHPAFDRIRPEHAVPAVEQILASTHAQLEALEASVEPEWDKLMVPLRRMQEPLDFAWGVISHMLYVMNSPQWRAAHETLQPGVVELGLRLGQSRPLYRCMRNLRKGDSWHSLDTPRRRIIESGIRAAELAGVGLEGAQAEEYNKLSRELAGLSTRFGNNLLDATKAFSLQLTTVDQVAGLPTSLLQSAAQAERAGGNENATAEDGPWRITLEGPLFVPFMEYSSVPQLREKLYRAFVTRASGGEWDNRPILERILEIRARIAELLGYDSYAEVSLCRKMAADVQAVDALEEDLRQAALPYARKDLDELRAFARAQGSEGELMNWDVAFWAEALRRERFDFSAEELRQYFPFPRVLEGLFELACELFRVRIVSADGEVPVWHPDVRFFRVAGESGEQIASFYLDPYSRPETKRGGAWLNPTWQRELKPDGNVSLPAACLVCNQTRPVDGKPCMMRFSEVTVLFHEFGHALQHLLTTIDEPEAAGMANIEWDAVELASQFMENWCYQRRTVSRISGRVDNGEPLPDDLFLKLRAARTYRSGSTILRQLFFGMLDMELHARYRPGNGACVAEAKQRVAAKTTVMPLLPEDRLLCAFAHVFSGSYAAGYYSYKWSEVLSADAFAAFEEAGLDDQAAVAAMGRRYRDTILAYGGGEDPMEVFRKFRGREPRPEPLLRHLGLLDGETDA